MSRDKNNPWTENIDEAYVGNQVGCEIKIRKWIPAFKQYDFEFQQINITRI